MFSVVAGTGYTGHRVLARLSPEASLGLGRTRIDTDRPFLTVDFDSADAFEVTLPVAYAVLYTCPPDGPGDKRLRPYDDAFDDRAPEWHPGWAAPRPSPSVTSSL